MQELRRQFLACREAWLAEQVADLDDSNAYDYLKRLTDVHRLQLFDVVMQYRAIFADGPLEVRCSERHGRGPPRHRSRPFPQHCSSVVAALCPSFSIPTCLVFHPLLQRMSMLTVSRWTCRFCIPVHHSTTIHAQASTVYAVQGDDSASGEPGAVYSWAAHRVGYYVDMLGMHLARLEEGGALASVLEHAMYCGMSLARVGLDFRMLLTPVFEACLLNLFARAAQVGPSSAASLGMMMTVPLVHTHECVDVW